SNKITFTRLYFFTSHTTYGSSSITIYNITSRPLFSNIKTVCYPTKLPLPSFGGSDCHNSWRIIHYTLIFGHLKRPLQLLPRHFPLFLLQITLSRKIYHTSYLMLL